MECGVCLEGLSSWWPSQDEAHCYVLDDDQVFMSALSRQPATLHDALYRRTSGAGGVTLLGRSVLLSAKLCPDGRSVVVVDPMRSRCVRLALVGSPERGVDVLEIVRLRPETVAFVPRPLGPPGLGALPSLEAMSRCFRYSCAPNNATSAMAKVRQFLELDPATPQALTVLLSGPSGSGKSWCVSTLLDLLPKGVFAPCRACNVRTVVERRTVDMSALFEHTFSSSGVADALQRILRPPAVSTGADQIEDGSAVQLVSLLVVCLRSVELLSSHSERAFVHVAADTLSRIVRMWPDRHDRCCRLLVVSDAIEVGQLHPVLTGQDVLARVHVQLSHPSEEMKVAIIKEALPTMSDADVAFAAARAFEKRADVGRIMSLCKTDYVKDFVRQRLVSQGADGAAFGPVVGLEAIVTDIQRLLIAPLMRPGLLAAMGIRCPKGALLVGPTGCGKTLVCACLTRALRSASHGRSSDGAAARRVDVVLVDALTLIDKHVGQTEKNIHAIFADARLRSPCVLIIDNIDAVAPPRERERQDSSNTADRSLSTLLVEMDGVRGSTEAPVVVVASARSADSLDAALCRPGRLDLLLPLSTPGPASLCTLLSSMLSPLLDGDREGLERGIAEVLEEAARSKGSSKMSFADAASVGRSVIMTAAPERDLTKSLPPPSLTQLIEALRKHVDEL